ncbi:MAG: class I SAM-dependent methyltransferase [Acidaminococcales bacterium]|jgi:SAM-dependent methyltransferase|nr:class I SAM-dependent methyltransferase [Acidaminococcales bacterium]
MYKSEDQDHVNKQYLYTLEKFGDSAKGVHWTRESQRARFEVLTRIGDLNNASVLDFGCGLGHLADFFREKGINVRYTGVDVLRAFVERARQNHPAGRFYVLDDFTEEKFDYIMISGVFNNKREDNRAFYQRCLRRLFPLADKGLAFNMLSCYANYHDEELFYEKPERVFEFVKTQISPFVTIRNDYQVRATTPPVDFCVYIYNRPTDLK